MNNKNKPNTASTYWLRERGTYNPQTRTIEFPRPYTPSHATDIRRTFAEYALNKQIERWERDNEINQI